jgi:hypothetical protein
MKILVAILVLVSLVSSKHLKELTKCKTDEDCNNIKHAVCMTQSGSDSKVCIQIIWLIGL